MTFHQVDIPDSATTFMMHLVKYVQELGYLLMSKEAAGMAMDSIRSDQQVAGPMLETTPKCCHI